MICVCVQEKEKILNAMKEKEERLQKEREAQDNLKKKISAMESKLLCGGKNIVDHTNEQQRALEQRRKEIADQQVGRAGIHIRSVWIRISCSEK